MSKSNYEIYAEEKQPKLLAKTVSLEQCIEKLKENSKMFHEDVVIDQADFVASNFGIDFSEIHDAINGKEHWCL